MSKSIPSYLTAGPRESGARCPHCNLQVVAGEQVATCGTCGAVHHALCWQGHDGCGSFDCAPARRAIEIGRVAALHVTVEEVERASPLPPARPLLPGLYPIVPERPRSRTSRLAIAAFVVAIAGIPLFGAVTGLAAIILGSLALGSVHQTRQRGTWLAVTGVLLGLADMVGWLAFIAVTLSGPGPALTLADFEPDAAALDHLSPRIARAVRANVLIETQGRWIGKAIGSGVILQLQEDSALIVTNRHVVDPSFARGETAVDDGLPSGQLQVKLIGQPLQPGRVVWVAPDTVDLALLTVPVVGEGAEAAAWQADRQLLVGEEVFSIGNPQHLDWTHTRGTISQLRLQNRAGRKVHVIQTDAALNPGNSGGGLYDHEGLLVGINTWISDKRFGEGLGFAIALDSLLGFSPPPLRDVRAVRAEAEPEE